MTCPACEIAERDPMTGHVCAFCDECTARSLALSPDFHESVHQRRRTPRYEAALAVLFKGREEQGNAMVHAWDKRIRAHNRKGQES